MAIGRPAIPIRLHGEEKEQLQSMTLPHGLVGPVPIILACAEGASHLAMARRPDLTR